LLSGGEGLIGDKIVSHYVTTSLITGFDSWNCLVLPELFKLRVPLALIYGEDDFVTPLMEVLFLFIFFFKHNQI
jgi:pimeloyl-ACP methyl ester carboxylesterase